VNKNQVKDLPASVHQKLLNKARETNRPFDELLQYYAIERFLYRLSRSKAAGHFVLKGALMFNVWGVVGFRPTRDIDLLGHTSNVVEQVINVFRKICETDVDPDGMTFDVESIRGERIKEDADYEGVRVTFAGFLGRTRTRMQIDIGFADIVTPKATEVTYPTLLDHPPVHLLGYPQETIIAEKFHAMVALSEINSRMKDFYDIWVLANQFEFDGELLQRAIEKTFGHRDTPLPTDIPKALTEAFSEQKHIQWDNFLRRIDQTNGIQDFARIIVLLQKFLMPPVRASMSKKKFKATWQKGNRWVEKE